MSVCINDVFSVQMNDNDKMKSQIGFTTMAKLLIYIPSSVLVVPIVCRKHTFAIYQKEMTFFVHFFFFVVVIRASDFFSRFDKIAILKIDRASHYLGYHCLMLFGRVEAVASSAWSGSGNVSISS